MEGTSQDGDGYGIPDECPQCTTLVSSEPPACAIDARQPSLPEGSGAAGWDQIELTFDEGCHASALDKNGFVIEVFPDGLTPAIEAVLPDRRSVSLVLGNVIERGKWTCFSHTATAGRACLGYLPGDVNQDGTANPAIDITALIDCLHNRRECATSQKDIDRKGDVGGIMDLLRLIDLFNGAGIYDQWNGETLGPCPSE